MKQNYGLCLLFGVFISLGLVINADPTDFLRRDKDQEDYNEPTEQSDFMHQTYTTKGGQTKERFAPIESIFGMHRDGGTHNTIDEERTIREDRENHR